MVHTVVNTGIDTLTNWHTSSSGDKRGSTDNHYKDWLNDMRVNFYETADYGLDWAGGGSGVDVETTFPASPSSGVSFARFNTNTSEFREYYYNGTSWIAINKSDQILIDVVPSPSPTYTTLQDSIDTLHSAGQISGGAITDAGSETINVAAGTGAIRISDSPVANLLFFNWAAETALAIPTDTSRHIGIEYNSGNPRVLVASSDSDFNEHDKFHLGDVVNEGGVLHVQNIPHAVANAVAHIIERFVQTVDPIRGFGLILSESADADRFVTVTAGSIWNRLTESPIGAIDTDTGGAADTFDIYYRDSPSGFIKVASQSAWDFDSYDNGSGTLATMSNNKYAVLWFYMEFDGALVAQYGRNQYNTMAGAENESIPSTSPDRISEHAILIGRIIFQESVTPATQVETVFETFLRNVGVVDHSGLGNITANDHHTKTSDADIIAAVEGEGTLDLTGLTTIKRNSGENLALQRTINGVGIVLDLFQNRTSIASPSQSEINDGIGFRFKVFDDVGAFQRVGQTWFQNDNHATISTDSRGQFRRYLTPVGSTVPSQVWTQFSSGIVRYDGVPGGSTGTDLIIDGSNDIYPKSSSLRYKENERVLLHDPSRIYQLQPKQFNYIGKPEEEAVGLIAEDVYEIMPEICNMAYEWKDVEREIEKGEVVIDKVKIEGSEFVRSYDKDALMSYMIEEMKKMRTEIDILKGVK